MNKRELISIVSKIMGLYFGISGLVSIISFVPMLSTTFSGTKDLGLPMYIGIAIFLVAYILGAFFVLIMRSDKVAAFAVKEHENIEINIGIGRNGLQQAVFFAAGIYLLFDIIYLFANTIMLFISEFKYGSTHNLIISGMNILTGLALVIWCGPISRWTDRLYKNVAK